jgi:hypothetical protein
MAGKARPLWTHIVKTCEDDLPLDGGEEKQPVVALSETMGLRAVSGTRADWAAARWLLSSCVQVPGADVLTGHAHAHGLY